MSTGPSIAVEKRSLDTKPKILREQGFILGSLYGHDVEATPIKFEYQAFRKAYRAVGDSTSLTVSLDGKDYTTIVHDVQYHPLSDNYTHVDFLALDDNKPTTATVPLILEGQSPAVKNLTAVLITPISSIEIQCLPKHLVKEIVVNIESLENFFDAITVGDLEISQNENITVLTDAAQNIVQAGTPKGGIKASEDSADEA